VRQAGGGAPGAEFAVGAQLLHEQQNRSPGVAEGFGSGQGANEAGPVPSGSTPHPPTPRWRLRWQHRVLRRGCVRVRRLHRRHLRCRNRTPARAGPVGAGSGPAGSSSPLRARPSRPARRPPRPSAVPAAPRPVRNSRLTPSAAGVLRRPMRGGVHRRAERGRGRGARRRRQVGDVAEQATQQQRVVRRPAARVAVQHPHQPGRERGHQRGRRFG
jgi:hypothetical protein